MMGDQQQSGEVVALPARSEPNVDGADRAFVMQQLVLVLLGRLVDHGVLTSADVAEMVDYVEREVMGGIGDALDGGPQSNAAAQRLSSAVRRCCASMRRQLGL
jgi:hypothetical protein